MITYIISILTINMDGFLIMLTSIALVAISWLIVLELTCKTRDGLFWKLVYCFTAINVIIWTLVFC